MSPAIAYEVQTFTLCDGWINTWTIIHEDGSTEPEIYATEAEAQAAIDEFLADIQAEIDAGERSPDEGYDRDDYRVARVQMANV